MNNIYIIIDNDDGNTILSPAFRYLEDAKEYKQTLIDYWFEKLFSEPNEETGLDRENKNHIEKIINQLNASFKIKKIPLH